MGKFIRVVLALLFALSVVIKIFDAIESVTMTSEESDGDYDTVDTIRTRLYSIHHRVWKDADDSERNITFSIPASFKNASYHYRDTVNVQYNENTEKAFWNAFYFDLYNHDKGYLKNVQDSLLALASRNAISKKELIYSVVSFVQDIKYNYILSNDSCFAHTDFRCVPLQRYGILSPVEFLYSLSGDCDTRTVLLFTLLKNLGYDPIIVNSYQYGHSMLAVNIPTQGDYFIHKGRKFYFWETTATGWMPGMLPPDMNNKDYWTIILDYEFEADPTRNY